MGNYSDWQKKEGSIYKSFVVDCIKFNNEGVKFFVNRGYPISSQRVFYGHVVIHFMDNIYCVFHIRHGSVKSSQLNQLVNSLMNLYEVGKI